MGMYGTAKIIYGFQLTEEEVDQFDEDYDIDDWCSENNLEYDFGGHIDWDGEHQWVVGVVIGREIDDFGVYELPDGYGAVKYEHYRKVAPFVHKFGREPKRFLVTNYG